MWLSLPSRASLEGFRRCPERGTGILRPFVMADHARQRGATPAAERPEKAFRVLIVEDGTSLDRDVADVLRGEQLVVDEADDFKEAVHRAHKHVPDLIVAPFQLDDKDGVEIVRALRFDPKLYPVRVLLVASPEARERAHEASANDVLFIPLDDQHLVEKVYGLLEGVEAERERMAAREGPADYTILVVDDLPFFRRVVCRSLQHRGFEVAEAESGEDAIETARDLRPDLILMDVRMPGMDGIEAARQIRLSADLHTIPIAMLSGYSEGPHVVEALSAGINDFLTKPFSGGDSIERLKVILGLEE